jgi:hypothetical protein
MYGMFAILFLLLFSQANHSFAESGLLLSEKCIKSVDTKSADCECLSENELKQFSGNWALKSIWEQLRYNKNWSAIKKDYVDAIQIDKNGNDTTIFGWHEGYSGCIIKHKKELWVIDDLPKRPIGPFVFIGKGQQIENYYFQRIFGDKCLISGKKEQWCFNEDHIVIDGKWHHVKILLDRSELPNYGTPLILDDNMDSVFIFVPYKSGWKIFKDTWASKQNYVSIDENTAEPWNILSIQ